MSRKKITITDIHAMTAKAKLCDKLISAVKDVSVICASDFLTDHIQSLQDAGLLSQSDAEPALEVLKHMPPGASVVPVKKGRFFVNQSGRC